MTRIHFGTVVAISAALVVAASAYAAPLETVTVTGSRGLTEKQVGRTPAGAPITELSLSYTVKISDLDSTSAAGLAEIRKRVTVAAKSACAELDRLTFGNPKSVSDAACVEEAVAGAMAKFK
ncbi:MAG: UrcA family protein [Steroidobacteraceae bacterium]